MSVAPHLACSPAKAGEQRRERNTRGSGLPLSGENREGTRSVSPHDLCQRLAEIGLQLREIAGQPVAAPDQDMIRAAHAAFRQQIAGKRAQAALQPVADHRRVGQRQVQLARGLRLPEEKP